MVPNNQSKRIGRSGKVTTSLSIGRRSKVQTIRFTKGSRRELTRAQIREYLTRTWDQDLEVMQYLKDR